MSEENIQTGLVLRIPPRPNDRVTECREPVGDEKWYVWKADVIEQGQPNHHPIYDFRRWIVPQPELVWPVGPFTVDDSPDSWMLMDGNGAEVQSREHYEAIALALTLLPECVAAMLKDQHDFPSGGRKGLTRDHRLDRDALLARWHAAGFKLREPSKK